MKNSIWSLEQISCREILNPIWTIFLTRVILSLSTKVEKFHKFIICSTALKTQESRGKFQENWQKFGVFLQSQEEAESEKRGDKKYKINIKRFHRSIKIDFLEFFMLQFVSEKSNKHRESSRVGLIIPKNCVPPYVVWYASIAQHTTRTWAHISLMYCHCRLQSSVTSPLSLVYIDFQASFYFISLRVSRYVYQNHFVLLQHENADIFGKTLFVRASLLSLFVVWYPFLDENEQHSV